MAGEALSAYLQRAGWGPRELARMVNTRLKRMIDPRRQIPQTAPYQWLKHGYCPYPPVPEVVAEVLSERLGQPITAEMLWPNRAPAASIPLSAGDGLAGPWAPHGVVRRLDELTHASHIERCRIRPAAGLGLVTLTLDGLRIPCIPLQAALDGERVLPPMMDLVDEHIAALRRLDDRQGGGTLSVRYVTGELQTVLDLIKGTGYSRDIGIRLHSAAADLAQLAGWMHFDAGMLGTAQRYLLLGLRLAKASEDTSLEFRGYAAACAQAKRTAAISSHVG